MIWIFFLSLFAVVVLVRIPFLSQPFVGEEGSFAYLIAGQPASSTLTPDGLPQMMIGMLDGTPALYPFQRTIAPYVLLENGPGAVIRALDIQHYSEAWRYVIIRSAYLALYLMGVAGVLWRSARQAAGQNYLPMMIVLFACVTPLAVGASIQPQIDGALGICLLGLASLLLTLGPQERSLKHRQFCTFLAGAFIGLGRHEWVISFLAAGVILGLALLAYKARRDVWYLSLRIGAFFCLGLIATTVLSFALSPSEYLSGFAVQQRVTGIVNPLVLLKRDDEFVIAAVLLLGLLGVLLFLRRRHILETAPDVLVVSGAAFVQCAGAAATGWPGDGFPRYYAPVFVLAATALIYLTSYRRDDVVRPNVWVARALSGVFLLLTAIAITSVIDDVGERVSISSNRGVSLQALEQHYDDIAETWRADPDRAPLALIDAGIWGRHPDISFLGKDMGLDSGYQYLQEFHPNWAERLDN